MPSVPVLISQAKDTVIYRIRKVKGEEFLTLLALLTTLIFSVEIITKNVSILLFKKKVKMHFTVQRKSTQVN